MKIKKVEIEAFRAYREKSEGTFDFTNEGDIPSNFVAIYAPNGFGKSSFYDAVEWAVTNYLTRFSDYNKSNNEIAARATKDPNHAQKILRNNFADINSVTKVSVSTTLPRCFERDLPVPKRNQKDLRIGDKSRIENAFFRNVILSQDEIDRFLRETNPQDRYVKFIESFGGELEQARKELHIFIIDNENEIKSLDNKQKSLIAKINEPIDLTSFEYFNTVASELNAMGERIILPSESFSTSDEYQLRANLVSRQYELNIEKRLNSEKLKLLTNTLEKIPEIELYTVKVAEQRKQLSRLQKGIADSERYQLLVDSYNKCVEDHKNLYTYQINFNQIDDNLDNFLKNEESLLQFSSKQESLVQERSKNSTEKIFVEQKLIELEQGIKTIDDRILFLKHSLDNAEPIYLELSKHRVKINDLVNKISNQERLIQQENTLYNDLNSKLSEIFSLKITSDLLSGANLGHFYFEQKKIEELVRCQTQLNSIAVHNQTILATQQALSGQMELHEQLSLIGLDYLSIHPSTICPLCTSSHSSSDELLNKIKSQNPLSELSQANSKKLAALSAREKELKTIIEVITQQAIEAQEQQLSALHKRLNEVNSRLTKAEQDRALLELEGRTLENKVLELENSVWNLSYEDLITRANTEIKEQRVKRSNLCQEQIDLKTKVKLLEDHIKAQDYELLNIVSEIDLKRNEYAYVKVSEYIKENVISVSGLRQHCEVKRNELNRKMLEYSTQKDSLIDEYKALNKEMVEDGNWIGLNQLKLQKENLEISLARIDSEIEIFYKKLSEFDAIRKDYPISEIKNIVSNVIEDYKKRVQNIEMRLNSINLLLELITELTPYINRVSAQKELVIIKKMLQKRHKVRQALNIEMQGIVESLKTLINNFFYEDLINSIYKKIDPHPAFKQVVFKVDFESCDKPCLNIVVKDETDLVISPILYFSAAQSNILSLSVFLANALHVKDNDGQPVDVILIDDPIQSMDSINILSTIDLLRSICIQFDKQIIISTHDENFFKLLQRKIPVQIFGSKFLELKKYGVAVPVESFHI